MDEDSATEFCLPILHCLAERNLSAYAWLALFLQVPPSDYMSLSFINEQLADALTTRLPLIAEIKLEPVIAQ